MVRNLKFHEQKLLKKVDFVSWKSEQNVREIEVIRRYHIQKRDDYVKYNKLCGHVKSITTKISKLDSKDPFRVEMTDLLLEKLYKMGLVPTKKNLSVCDSITASSFCRRRLPVVMVRLKLAESVKEAVQFVEQGHIRVGPTTVTDPAFLVTRTMEDFVTWVDTSKIKRHVMKYNDKLDDFDLL
eukprot:Colp12_sorted_trinity150504_noHs@19893